MRRFCVMTTGRSGSTALMDALAVYPDVATPGRHLKCADHELLHPKRVKGFARDIACMYGQSISSELDFIDAFYALNEDRAFAGFKSMPNRHRALQMFVSREDVQIITLVRGDVLSTAASFLLAMTQNTWRRDGGVPEERLEFRPEHINQLTGNLSYLKTSLDALEAIPDAIHVSYEELCNPKFFAPELNAFFERPVQLPKPKAPVHSSSYITNHDEFEDFVREAYARLNSGS